MSDFIIKVNHQEQIWSKEVIQSKLEQIGKLEGKKIAWIRSDLSLKKSNWLSRIIWTLVVKHFTIMRRAFYDVDLEQSRCIFDQLLPQIKNSEDQELIILFNHAVKKFNSIAGQHASSLIKPSSEELSTLEAAASLREQLQTGRAAFDETSVQKMVSNPSLHQQSDYLNHLLKYEYVQQQLRDLNKFTVVPETEMLVLEALKYNVNRYEDKITIKKSIETALKDRCDELVQTSATILELKQNIKQLIQECRLKFALVPDGYVRRIQILVNKTAEYQEIALAGVKEILEEFDETRGITHAINREYIKQLLHGVCHKLAKYTCEEFIKNQRRTIQRMLDSSSDEEWKSWFHSFKDHCKLNASSQSSEIDYMRDLATFLRETDQWFVINVSQRQDFDAVLGYGVCLAQCIRLSAQEQDHPDIDGEMLLETCNVLPSDRFAQAAIQTSTELYRKAFDSLYEKALEDGLLTAEQISEEIMIVQINELLRIMNRRKTVNLLFTTDESNPARDDMTSQSIVEKFIERLEANKESLKVSNGVIMLELEGPGHQIYMRVDEERRIYRLYDPNIGRLRFPDFETQSMFLRGLCGIYYTNISKVTTLQLVDV